MLYQFIPVIIAILYLTDFLKTSLTKFAVTGVKRRQIKAGFLSPKSSKITITKGKEKKKEQGEGNEEEKKKAEVVALLVFVIAALDIKMPI